MQSTGIYRRIDALGRFVLPKELRRNLDIKENDYLQVFTEGDAIILKKSQMSCILCGSSEDLVDHHEKKICRTCIRDLSEK
ncbi:MAG: AbrB/MazE/SpoVT family DNA-binding domain-containing protein [Oscillospiraceae bacterium]|jgi:transcriptional pleiotropic regulator of transition state genes|nr:AbrB/MazE/SpoVT family DNA-binding domain-containing protein [Oscillospiraceae bacterium]